MPAYPSSERIELHVLAEFKIRALDAADKEGLPLGEFLLRAACKGLGWSAKAAVPPRGVPGRRPVTAEDGEG